MLEGIRRLPQTPWGAVGLPPNLATVPWAIFQLQSWALTMVCRRQNGTQLRLLVQGVVGGGGGGCSVASRDALTPA